MTPLQNGHRSRGIGTYVRGLALRLLEQETVPIEFWGWADDRPFAPPAPPHRGLWLPRLGVPRTRYPALLRAAMRIRLRLSRAAAVHITDPNALIASNRRPLLTTVYDLIPLHRPGAAGKGYPGYLERVRAATVLFAISEATAEDVVASLGVPPGRVILAQPGIAIPRGGELRATPMAAPYFLYVGSPDPHKNLDVMLKALEIGRDLPERLALVGSWPEASVAELKARVAHSAELSGRVEHLGYVDPPKLLALYRSATAVVVPSLSEGFGLPVAEALAAGVPVIHSSLPVLQEVSAGSALTFDAPSAEQLAACLRAISGDTTLRAQLIARGLGRAQSLTWTGALERTLGAYRQALAGGSPSSA